MLIMGFSLRSRFDKLPEIIGAGTMTRSAPLRIKCTILPINLRFSKHGENIRPKDF